MDGESDGESDVGSDDEYADDDFEDFEDFDDLDNLDDLEGLKRVEGGGQGESAQGPCDSAVDATALRTHKVLEHVATDDVRLPEYLRGGRRVAGFGPLLGQALSLLYVARHGLRAEELRALLSLLTEQQRLACKADRRAEAEARLLHKLSRNKMRIIDTLRAFDASRTGMISEDEFRRGVGALHVEMDRAALNDLVRSCGFSGAARELPYEGVMSRFSANARAAARGSTPRSAHRGGAATARGPPAHAGASLKALSLGAAGPGGTAAGCAGALLQGEWGAAAGKVVSERHLCTINSDVERSLLSALEVLGVMHSREDGVLVLPTESELLRRIVYRRYIQTEEALTAWHLRLARYFQRQPQSVRRCEELPWQLQKCRRWAALKGTVADLRTFELMYASPTLRLELFEYWTALSEGPLYVSKPAERLAAKALAESQALPLVRTGAVHEPADLTDRSTVLLAQLDSAAARDLTKEKAKAEALRGQVATFDVVEEYNHEVEAWLQASRPHAGRLRRVLLRLAHFMHEFSRHSPAAERPYHPFLRPAIPAAVLRNLGIADGMVLGAVDRAPTSPSTQGPDGAPVPDADGAAADGGTSPGGTAHGDPSLAEPLPSSEDGAGADPGGVRALGAGQDGPTYLLQRWIWTQFPWMALAEAAAHARTAGDAARGSAGDGGLGPLAVAGASSAATPRSRPSSRSRSSRGLGRDSSRSPRSGDSGAASGMGRQGQKGLARGGAPSGPSDGTQRRDPRRDRSLQALDKEVASLLALIDGRAERPVPRRARLLPEEHAGRAVIPFSYPSERSKRRGSRFPSVEMMHQRDLERKAGAMDDFALEAPRRFGGQGEVETVRELIEIREQEARAAPSAQTMTFPSTRDDTEQRHAADKLARLRGLYDRYRSLARSRRSELGELQRQLSQRRDEDAHRVERQEAAKQVVRALRERLERVDAARGAAERLGSEYGTIVQTCQRHPARDPRRLAMLEQQVRLVRQQSGDLLRRRQEIYAECEDIGTRGVVDAHAELRHYRAQRAKLAPRIEELRRRVLSLTQRLGCRPATAYYRTAASRAPGRASPSLSPTATALRPSAGAGAGTGAGTGAGARPSAGSAGESAKSCWRAAAEASLRRRPSWTGLPDLSGLAHRDRAEGALRYLAGVAGSSDAGDLAEKYATNARLAEDLKEQQAQFEGRAGELKAKLALVQAELEELRLGGTPGDELGATQDVRKAEKDLCRKEAALHQSQRKAQRAHSITVEVRAGVMHLAQLVRTVCSQLSRDSNGGRFLPHEAFPELDVDQDAWRVVTAIEDRLVSMAEASAPDATRQLGDDARKTLLERQNDLVDHINGAKKEAAAHLAHLAHPSETRASHGSAPHRTVHPNDTSSIFSSSRIHVVATERVDDDYDAKVAAYHAAADERAQREEAEAFAVGRDATEGIAQFLSEALDTRESETLLRRANILSDRPQGRSSGFGAPIEDMLSSTEEGTRALRHARKHARARRKRRRARVRRKRRAKA